MITKDKINPSLFRFLKSLFCFESLLLSTKRVSNQLIIEDSLESLMALTENKDFKGVNYESLLVASSRILVFPFIDFEKVTNEKLISFFGLTTKSKKFLEQLRKLAKDSASDLEYLRTEILNLYPNFKKETKDFANGILTKFEILNIFNIKTDKKGFLEDRRKELFIKKENKADEIKTTIIINFYSSLFSAPFMDLNIDYTKIILHIGEILGLDLILNLFEKEVTFLIFSLLFNE